MKLTKDKLFSAIADLVDMLREYNCDDDTIIFALTHYGFTKEQIKDWYGLETSGFETYNEAPYGEKK
jgi:glutamate racemase